MTQHINLLTRHRARQSMAWFATRGLTGLLGLFVLWALVTEVGLQKLSLANDDVQQTMLTLKAELEAKRREAGLEDAQALAKESAGLRRRMEEHLVLMQLVQKGELGSLAGHSRVIQVLASTPQPGVWLQGVDITSAGQHLNVLGYANSTAAVMQYAEQLNRSFQTMNIEFSSLEMSTEDVSATATSPKSSAIKFRLH